MTLKTLAICDCCGEESRHDKVGYPSGWLALEGTASEDDGNGTRKVTLAFCVECKVPLLDPARKFKEDFDE